MKKIECKIDDSELANECKFRRRSKLVRRMNDVCVCCMNMVMIKMKKMTNDIEYIKIELTKLLITAKLDNCML